MDSLCRRRAAPSAIGHEKRKDSPDATAFTDGAGASSGERFRPLSKSVKVSESLADVSG